jgi:hypothetical protein
VKIFSSKRRVAAAGALVLLMLFLIRPGASRLKSRIIASISTGVGRSVDIGSVHFRLLPRPGFDLDNLVVYDDPAFGAEPMLRASEVNASLRLTSLLRGRLEIARLELTEPSLNLVHAVNGGWNLEALVERAAHMPLAPTGKAKSEPRRGFPYIVATSARINFKQGPEKKPYALTNADFSLWQDSENTWGVRLKAQPVRTDLNLNDTGLLQVNGRWQRAERIRDTPVQFTVEWTRAQLGQMTKLFTGNDQGWRGDAQLDVTMSGTPAKLEIVSNVAVHDFRRYDIAAGDALNLAAHCDGNYSSPEHIFHEVLCTAPAGNGQITMKADVALPWSAMHDIKITAESVPASLGLMLAQRMKKNLPADLVADGELSGSASFVRSESAQQTKIEGRGEIADFQLSSASTKSEIGPVTVPLVLSATADGRAALRRTNSHKAPQNPEGKRLDIGPFPLGARISAPTVRGFVTATGYGASIAGDAEIGRTLRIARMFGLAALQTTAEGTADIDLKLNGTWAQQWGRGVTPGFGLPQVTGTAKLRNVHVEVRGAEAAEILSAELQLKPDEVRVEKLVAKAGGTLWTGSLGMPRGCGTPDACEAHFNLNANQISLADLSDWANPKAKQRPWYSVLSSSGQDSAQAASTFLKSLRASGRITADRMEIEIQDLTMSRVSSDVRVNRGKVEISGASADFSGGKHNGTWQVDFGVRPSLCNGSGTLMSVSLARLAEAKNSNSPVSGTASIKYELKGECARFWNSAEGTVQFDVTDAVLPRVSLTADKGALAITQLTGQARWHGGVIELKDAQLDSTNGGEYLVSGTAGLNHEMNFKLVRPAGVSGGAYAITGKWPEPQVVALPGPEQARLKTETNK